MFVRLFAQTPTPFINPGNFAPARFDNLATFVNVFWPLLVGGGALLFGAMFLYMGFLMITAGPDKEQLEKSKKTLQYAILGLLLVMTAYLIVQVLGFLFNIEIPI